MATKALTWSGLKGGKIGVGFDDAHFALQQMKTEIDLVGQAYPDLPDEVPPGTSFVFGKDGTGHLSARFRVGTTVYRGGGQGDLRRLWDTVGLIDRLLHAERLEPTSQGAVRHQRGGDVYQREMVLYTRGRSLRCWRARRFLSRAGYGFEVVDVGGDPEMLERLSEAAHRKMAPPYVFVDRRPVGDMSTVRALAGSGRLERLLRDRL